MSVPNQESLSEQVGSVLINGRGFGLLATVLPNTVLQLQLFDSSTEELAAKKERLAGVQLLVTPVDPSKLGIGIPHIVQKDGKPETAGTKIPIYFSSDLTALAHEFPQSMLGDGAVGFSLLLEKDITPAQLDKFGLTRDHVITQSKGLFSGFNGIRNSRAKQVSGRVIISPDKRESFLNQVKTSFGMNTPH